MKSVSLNNAMLIMVKVLGFNITRVSLELASLMYSVVLCIFVGKSEREGIILLGGNKHVCWRRNVYRNLGK